MAPSSEGDRADIIEEIHREVIAYQALDNAYQELLGPRSDVRPDRWLRKFLSRIEDACLTSERGPHPGDVFAQRLGDALVEIRSRREQDLWRRYLEALHRWSEPRVLSRLSTFGPDVARLAYDDAFVSLWHRPPQFDPQRDPAGWLLTVARHKAIDEVRRRSRSAEARALSGDVLAGEEDIEREVSDASAPELADCPHGRELKVVIEIILRSDPAEWAGNTSYAPGLPQEVVRRRLAGEGTCKIASCFHPEPYQRLPTAESVVSRISRRFVEALGYFGFFLLDEDEDPGPGSEFLRSVPMQVRRRWLVRRLYYRPTCEMSRVLELADLHVPMVLKSNGHLANGSRVAELRDGAQTLSWVCRREVGR